MVTITIPKSKLEKGQGVVVLPVKEYQRLIRAAVPMYYLKGKAARNLDKLVEEGLREYRAGKTISADSTSSALKAYRGKHAR